MEPATRVTQLSWFSSPRTRWPSSKSSPATTAPNTARGRRGGERGDEIRNQRAARLRYEFLRNTDLNAIGFTFSPAVFQKPTLQRNQFGFTVVARSSRTSCFTSPITKDFASCNGISTSIRFPHERSQRDLPVSVYDPLNKTLYPAGTTISISQLNPFAATVLGALPTPNDRTFQRRRGAAADRDYGDKFDAKIDGQINDRMTAFLRFSQRRPAVLRSDLTGSSGGMATVTFTWSIRTLRWATPGP